MINKEVKDEIGIYGKNLKYLSLLSQMIITSKSDELIEKLLTLFTEFASNGLFAPFYLPPSPSPLLIFLPSFSSLSFFCSLSNIYFSQYTSGESQDIER